VATGRRPETMGKREREQARREKRERKQAKKDAVVAARVAEANPELEPIDGSEPEAGDETSPPEADESLTVAAETT
jgi:hypothetical protein